jgi:hypothetical protein
MASLQEIDASLAESRSSAGVVASSLSDLTSEIDARIAEDMRLLTASSSLDMLHQVRITWQSFADDLSEIGKAFLDVPQRAHSKEYIGGATKLIR